VARVNALLLNDLLGWQITGRIKTILSLHSAVVLYGFSYAQSQAVARFAAKFPLPSLPGSWFYPVCMGIDCTPSRPFFLLRHGEPPPLFPEKPGSAALGGFDYAEVGEMMLRD
jgi:hypothetical protein